MSVTELTQIRTPLPIRGLYAITDAQLLPPEKLVAAVQSAIQGGAAVIQYRDKLSAPERRLAQAQALLALCRRQRVPLIVNDDLALAERIGADGVHLGRTDGSIAEARRRLGNDAIVGATCHNSLDFALEARNQGASYVAFGAFFPSTTKPQAQTASPEILANAKQATGLPVVAIGGIRLENAATLLAAGADFLAVIGDLFSREDVESRARALSALINTGPA